MEVHDIIFLAEICQLMFDPLINDLAGFYAVQANSTGRYLSCKMLNIGLKGYFYDTSVNCMAGESFYKCKSKSWLE